MCSATAHLQCGYWHAAPSLLWELGNNVSVCIITCLLSSPVSSPCSRLVAGYFAFDSDVYYKIFINAHTSLWESFELLEPNLPYQLFRHLHKIPSPRGLEKVYPEILQRGRCSLHANWTTSVSACHEKGKGYREEQLHQWRYPNFLDVADHGQ